jgi:protein TonB
MVPAVEIRGVHDYPEEKRYVPWGMFASIGVHLIIVTVILILAYVHHIRSLRELMTASMVAPPPDQIEILIVDEKKQPPPTANPLWIMQIIIPKFKPPPPPPPPKPKPKPQAVRVVSRIEPSRYNLAEPTYPAEAWQNHIEGTVILKVSFDGSGGVIDAEVEESSGSALLDSSTRHFILSNWHCQDLAGQVEEVPIRFQLPH